MSSLTRHPDRIVPMRVIVCGVQRTGTESMRVALRLLGFHDCYHMRALRDNSADAPLWLQATNAKYKNKGTFTRADWDKLLGSYQATCDLPATLFAPEIAEAYPEAKVVILNRDPEKWYESMLNSIYVMLNNKSPLNAIRMIYLNAFDDNVHSFVMLARKLFSQVITYDHGKEKDKALQWFHDQYAEYRKRIPAERCLEFRVQDGWEPLCKHLGVPVPMVEDEKTGKLVALPFPRVNDREQFFTANDDYLRGAMQRANTKVFSAIGRLTVIGALGYFASTCGYLAWQTRLGGRF